MAEVQRDAEEYCKLSMLPEQDIVVEGEALHLRDSHMNPNTRIVYRLDAHIHNELKECHPCLSIDHDKKYPASSFPRYHKVSLHIADTLPCIDI